MTRSILPTLRQFASTLGMSASTVAELALGRGDMNSWDERLRRWATRGVRTAEIDVRIFGLDHVALDEPFVVMSNHLSNWDIVLLYYTYPGASLRMVAKAEMRKYPFMGRAMERTGFVFVDRVRTSNAKQALSTAVERVRAGVSVWIAPEGTRSRDGRLLPFRKGGFHLARDAGVRILPVTLVGTWELSPPGGVTVERGARVEVHYHAPIDPKSVADLPELVRMVRTQIASVLPPDKIAPDNLR